ncbi:MAG: hypothetical protein JRH16_19520 [Deltaproteobacteria bacterium]|nr:hypothetical protein [Deltaproteobacteria bacterium]
MLAACTTPGAAPEPLGGADRLVLAPLNLAVKLPVELEDGVEPVRDEIIAYLKRRDARVAVLWPSDAWELWKQSMLASAGAEDGASRLEQAVGLFVEELARNAEFGAFMLPTLVYREAEVWGDTARWDGVRRRLPLRTRSTANARLPTLEPSIGESRVRGAKVPGVSLHVMVFAPDGRRVFEGWGGLDLVHAVLVTGSAETGHGNLVPDLNPFRNPDHLREGIALALDTYVSSSLQ